MRILLYGECDQYGSGAWCYYDTLKDMGHEVDYYTQFEHLQFYSTNLLYRVIRKVKGGMVLESHRKKHVRGLERKVNDFKPDILIVLKGLLLDKQLIRTFRKAGTWTTLINHDDFFSKFRTNRSKIQWQAVPEYNYVFCTKEVNVKEVKPFNGNVEMFLFAYNPKIHFPPGDLNEKEEKDWTSDVVFVGNSYPERIKQLEYLVQTIGSAINLKIYGPNWNKLKRRSSLSPYIQEKYLLPAEMRKAIFCAKISLGFLCKENRDDYTQRTFEVPACKGVLLAERTERHLTFYQEGKEAEFFDANNYTELTDKVKLLLMNDDHLAGIRNNGFNKVRISGHTYADRIQRLLDLYDQKPVTHSYSLA